MKDHLLELIEGITNQLDSRIPLDNSAHGAIELIRDALENVRVRLQQLEMSNHDRVLREAGIQLGDV